MTRPKITKSSLVAFAVSAILSAHAGAADSKTTQSIDIPAGDLTTALETLARQAGVELVYRPEQLKGLRTDGVHGALTSEQAVEKLLEGTPLRLRADASGVLLISDASSKDGSLHMAQADASGAASGDDIDEVVVSGVKFRYEEAQSAMKIPLALKDTPQTVLVVTKDLMDFAGIHQFSDIYKIDASGGTAHAGDQVPRNYYRGFRQQSANSIKVDGFRMSGRTNLDLSLFERFEVVKGPTSTLYGQNSIGGTLNAVSKLPQPDFGGNFSVEAGSYDHYRGDLDFYGPLGSSDRVSYRMVASWLDEDLPVDFTYSKRLVLAPSVKFELTPDTTLITRVSYQKSQFPYYFGYGLQFLGTDRFDLSQVTRDNFKIPDLPRDRAANMPWNKTERSALFALTTLEHRFGENWNLRANLQYNHLTEEQNSGQANAITGLDGLTGASIYAYDDNDHVYAGEVNLYGDVEMFGRKHTLFFGADYARLDNRSLFADDSMSGEQTGFSILDPDYSLIPRHSQFSDYAFFFGEKSRTKQSGFTAQAILHPTDRFTALLGGRYSRDVEDDRTSCCALDSALGENTHTVNDDFTFQGGVTFKVTESTNLYASYGETFEPQSGTLANGASAGPQQGTSKEIGAKGELLDRGLSWSVALFDMRRAHITQRVLGTSFVEEAGTQRSRGAEVELKGDFKNGWNLFGSFAYLDAEYIAGEFKGAQPVNAPKYGASVFGSYEFLDGPMKGLGFGAGLVHKEKFSQHTVYYASTTPTILPFGMEDDFTEVDFRTFYRHDRWYYHLGVTNLFNTKYFVQHMDNFAAPYLINPARTVIGRVTYQF